MTDPDPLNWGPRRSPFNGYDTAQVCINGHPTTSALTLVPGASKAFCPECGAKTISSCQQCDFPIRGSSTEVLVLGYTPPKYCENCGEAYPWTAQALTAAKELADTLDRLSDREKADFTESVAQVAADTPKTPIAAAKLKRLLGKVGQDAYQVAIKIITDVATESAKKQLGL